MANDTSTTQNVYAYVSEYNDGDCENDVNNTLKCIFYLTTWITWLLLQPPPTLPSKYFSPQFQDFVNSW